MNRRYYLANPVDTSWEEKLGIASLVAAGALAITGAILYYKGKRKSGGSLGQAKVVDERVSPEGMKSKMYFDDKMPIQERVKIIQHLIEDSIKDPGMREVALKVTAKCPARDGECEARAIYSYVRNNIRYTGDIAPIKMKNGTVEGIDLFQSARRTMQFGGGDCDDHSILVSTLATLNGIPAQLRITAPKNAKGNDAWSHIYPVLGIPKTNPSRWIAADTTLPGENFGREASYSRKLDFPA